MTRLTATLGSTGLAALLLVAAVQFLPARDGGAAQAAAVQAAVPAAIPAAVTGDAAAWSDPPRAAVPAPAPVAARQGATVQAAALRFEAPAPAADAQADRDRPLARRAARAGRPHLRFTARPRRVAARTARPGPAIRTASARIRGPIGDILHGLGLD